MVKHYTYIDITKESFDLHGKNLIIWGRGFSALNLLVQLKTQNECNIMGFTDSFVTESGTTFAGFRVFTFEELQDMCRIWGGVILYISTSVNEYKIQILEKTQELKNATVLIRGQAWGCGEYDTNSLREKIQRDKDEIDFVRNSLCDAKSIKAFDNLLNYRMSNDPNLIKEVYEREHPQYFPDSGILVPEMGEIFIDAGGYNGATSCEFSKWNENYSKIYLMEPDDLMFRIAQEYVKLKGLQDVVYVNKGAYSCSTELYFKNIAESGSSRIDEAGTSKISTISIDEMLDDGGVTYIKMDIEGAEMEALIGAEKSITKYKPKLAISIYHKEDDLWKIPYYIKKKYPEYKLYIRHYTLTTIETVLYATV